MAIRAVWVTALACLAILLASASSEVQELGIDASEAPALDSLQEAMNQAANKTAEIAVKAAKATLYVQEQAVAAANPEGLPQHVIDALKKENIIVLIRAALQTAALKMDKSDDPDDQAEAALNNRISKATEASMQDPLVLEAAKEASSQVVKADIKKIEVLSDMKKKVGASLKKSVHKQELKAETDAVADKKKDVQQEKLLKQIQGELQDDQSIAATRNKITKAKQDVDKKNDFLKSDHKANEQLRVREETARVMEVEEKKLKAQVGASAQEQVEAGLAGKVAKEAQQALTLKMTEIREQASKKVDAELAKEAKDNKQDSERGYFSMAVALDKVQGYWARRRRFAREKKFVTHAKLFTPERSPAEEREDTAEAEALIKKQAASEDARLKALRSKRMDEEMKKLLPKGGVKALVKKLALKSSKSEADGMADPHGKQLEVKAVANAVAEVVREKEEAANDESKKSAEKSAQAKRAIEGKGDAQPV